MQYRDNKRILKDLKTKLEKLIMRNFVMQSVSDYDESATYVIYDDNKVELFDETFLEVNKSFKHIKSYFISKPFKA